MSDRIAADVAFLQRAADTAGLALWPGKASRTFPEGNTAVSPGTLQALGMETEHRRTMPVDYRVIDLEAVLLLQVARQLALHRADNNEVKVERFQKLGEYLRSCIEIDLASARKTIGVPA